MAASTPPSSARPTRSCWRMSSTSAWRRSACAPSRASSLRRRAWHTSCGCRAWRTTSPPSGCWWWSAFVERSCWTCSRAPLRRACGRPAPRKWPHCTAPTAASAPTPAASTATKASTTTPAAASASARAGRRRRATWRLGQGCSARYIGCGGTWCCAWGTSTRTPTPGTSSCSRTASWASSTGARPSGSRRSSGCTCAERRTSWPRRAMPSSPRRRSASAAMPSPGPQWRHGAWSCTPSSTRAGRPSLM
mmetsp:Transcript_4163/g.14927  ORF Transcript_4163/g.14927 Transcript_4163/m.14927 type:complete len:249 (+) Transcript_4163:892-1638(+)